MMKALKFALLLVSAAITSTIAQDSPERINYAHQYNPQETISMHVVSGMRPSGEFEIMISVKDREERTSPDFRFSFYGLSDYTSTLNDHITYPASERMIGRSGSESIYSFRFEGELPRLMICKLTDEETGLAYFENVEPMRDPFPSLLIGPGGIPLLDHFVNKGKYDISAAVPVTIDYYDHEFPVALPPMSTSEPEVARTLVVSGTFSMDSSFNHIFDEIGLYVAKDAENKIRMVYRVEDVYFPEYVTIEDLVKPLVYITTKEEREHLLNNMDDKKVFDRFWLDLTGSKDNARWIIKNYYQRIAEANEMFTTYKEGWKTDRGMLYTIFGPPDEVMRTGKEEYWNYKGGNDIPSLTFKFATIKSPYAPRQYVLARNPALAEDWITAVKTWRKGMPINDL